MEQIFLAPFRAVNNIKQKELADLLSTSTSFLSLVETGKSKLSDSKIDKILDEARKKGWDISDFNPAFYRIVFACSEAQSMQNCFDNDKDVDLDWDTGHNPYDIPKIDILNIKHGKIGITEEIANKILNCNSSFNIEWLLHGEGNPFNFVTEIYDTRGKTEYEILLDRMDHICNWLSSNDGRLHLIEDKINRINKQLAKKMQVTDEQ